MISDGRSWTAIAVARGLLEPLRATDPRRRSARASRRRRSARRRPRRTTARSARRAGSCCRRRRRSAARGRGGRRASDASEATPSCMSPSDAIVNVRWSTTSCPSWLKRAASIRSASASPTDIEIPWPSGPVVASIPGLSHALRVPGGRPADLTEVLDVVERHRVAGQIQASNRAASTRGRPTARSGHGRSSLGCRGCAA